MIGIWDKLKARLQCQRLQKLEARVNMEITKHKLLSHGFELATKNIEANQRHILELKKHLEELADGLQIIGQAVEQLSTNNNEMIPKILTLETNQIQLARNLEQLTRILVDSDIIPRIIPDFERFH